MPTFAQSLNKEIEWIPVPLTVVGPKEQNFTITQMVRECEINICGYVEIFVG